MRMFFRFALILALGLLFPALALAQAPAVFLAGAAQADITPKVKAYEDRNQNGLFDKGDPTAAFGFGDPVIEFEDGQILVGNGNGPAKYIYDSLWAYALVVENPITQTRVALVSADVYLLTGSDIEKIRSMVDPKYQIDFIVISATHNHMGPDTLGVSGLGQMPVPKIINAWLKTGKAESGINPAWFEGFRRKIVGCIETAAQSMRPANITFAQTPFRMGLNDMREPKITDPLVNIMAVDGIDGAPIATLIQWTNHPETVLEYGRPGYEFGSLSYADLTQEQKDAWGKVLTAGFPGYARAYLAKHRGGVPLYFNGAIGGMQTPLRAKLWDPEKHPQYPPETPLDKVPDDILIPNDFRFAPVLGRELAKKSLQALKDNGVPATDPNVAFAKKDVLVPLKNHLFRTIGAMGVQGYEPGALYDDQGIIDPHFGSWIGGFFMPGVQAPTGKNVKAQVSVVNIGPAQFVSIPAEPLPELIRGLPDDFVEATDTYYPQNKAHHAHAKEYRLAKGPLVDSATGEFLFVFGLSGGELGYVIPQSDFDPPHDLKIPPFYRWWICFDAAAHPHYEESNAISPDVESRLLGPLHELLQANPVGQTAEKPVQSMDQK
jgi:hypothetical protein